MTTGLSSGVCCWVVTILLVVIAQCANAQLGGCQVNTGSSTIDLTKIPTTMIPIMQSYLGKDTQYTWTMNMCQVVDQAPTGVTPCGQAGKVAGYIQEYGSSCETSFYNTTIAPQWDAATSAVIIQFANTRGWTASVSITCGTTADLTSPGNVHTRTASSGALDFAFALQSNVVCSAGPTPPTVQPSPPAPTTTAAPSSGYTKLVMSSSKDNWCSTSTSNTTFPLNTCVNGGQKFTCTRHDESQRCLSLIRFSKEDSTCAAAPKAFVMSVCNVCMSLEGGDYGIITHCDDPFRAQFAYNCSPGCGSCTKTFPLNSGKCDVTPIDGYPYRVVGYSTCGTIVTSQEYGNSQCSGQPVQVTPFVADACLGYKPGPGSNIFTCQ